MGNTAKLLFVFGEHKDGHVDVSDGENDILIRVPRSVAEPVIKWSEEQAQVSDGWRAEVVRLRAVLNGIESTLSARVADYERAGMIDHAKATDQCRADVARLRAAPLACTPTKEGG
jgi:hypothetical protein